MLQGSVTQKLCPFWHPVQKLGPPVLLTDQLQTGGSHDLILTFDNSPEEFVELQRLLLLVYYEGYT